MVGITGGADFFGMRAPGSLGAMHSGSMGMPLGFSGSPSGHAEVTTPNHIIKIGDITKSASTLAKHKDEIVLLGYVWETRRSINPDSTGTMLASGSVSAGDATIWIRLETCVPDILSFYQKGTMVESILITELITVNGAEEKAGTHEFGNCLFSDVKVCSDNVVRIMFHYSQNLLDRIGRNSATGKAEGTKSFSTDYSTGEVG